MDQEQGGLPEGEEWGKGGKTKEPFSLVQRSKAGEGSAFHLQDPNGSKKEKKLFYGAKSFSRAEGKI